MGLLKKKKEKEPEFFVSATNIPTINYNVYYMKLPEKILTFLLAFAVGALVGYVFYGGMAKDEFGQPTATTYFLNCFISGIVGTCAGFFYLPQRVDAIIKKRKKMLANQFRDMLDSLTTSLNAGKNVNDSFFAVLEDLKMQYDEDAFIIKELDIIISGIHNNVAIEDSLEDFGRRSGNDDIKSFAGIFRISYRKGGNIKDIIRNTHTILSDKMSLKEDIETTVSSNKMEQNIMLIMPVALVGMIKAMSPEFAENFVTGAGLVTTTGSIFIFAIAYVIGKKVLEIKV